MGNIIENVNKWLDSINDWLKSNVSEKAVKLLMDLYNQFIDPIPELVKYILAFLLVVVIILGIISFIKKTFKLFVVIAVILLVVIIASRFL